MIPELILDLATLMLGVVCASEIVFYWKKG